MFDGTFEFIAFVEKSLSSSSESESANRGDFGNFIVMDATSAVGG